MRRRHHNRLWALLPRMKHSTLTAKGSAVLTRYLTLTVRTHRRALRTAAMSRASRTFRPALLAVCTLTASTAWAETAHPPEEEVFLEESPTAESADTPPLADPDPTPPQATADGESSETAAEDVKKKERLPVFVNVALQGLVPQGTYKKHAGPLGVGFAFEIFGGKKSWPVFIGLQTGYDVNGKEDVVAPVNGGTETAPLSSSAFWLTAGAHYEPRSWTTFRPYLSATVGFWQIGHRIKESSLDASLNDDFAHSDTSALGVFTGGFRLLSGEVSLNIFGRLMQGSRVHLMSPDELQSAVDESRAPVAQAVTPQQFVFGVGVGFQ